MKLGTKIIFERYSLTSEFMGYDHTERYLTPKKTYKVQEIDPKNNKYVVIKNDLGISWWVYMDYFSVAREIKNTPKEIV